MLLPRARQKWSFCATFYNKMFQYVQNEPEVLSYYDLYKLPTTVCVVQDHLLRRARSLDHSLLEEMNLQPNLAPHILNFYNSERYDVDAANRRILYLREYCKRVRVNDLQRAVRYAINAVDESAMRTLLQMIRKWTFVRR